MARFEAYEERKYWWWYFYLALAAAKDSPAERAILVDVLMDALAYKDNYDNKNERDRMKKKYNVENGKV